MAYVDIMKTIHSIWQCQIGKTHDKWLKTRLSETIKLTQQPSTTQVSLLYVGETRMCGFNRQYRHKNKPTDVLSFASEEFSKQHGYLGDLIICPAVARRQAKKNLKRELTLLVVHGYLHLLGYEHEGSSQNANKMFTLQNKILRHLLGKNISDVEISL